MREERMFTEINRVKEKIYRKKNRKFSVTTNEIFNKINLRVGNIIKT